MPFKPYTEKQASDKVIANDDQKTLVFIDYTSKDKCKARKRRGAKSGT